MKKRQGKQPTAFRNSEFRKSSLSGEKWRPKCVEVAIRPDVVGIRDSKNPTGPVLEYTRLEWEAFIQGVKTGEFDI